MPVRFKGESEYDRNFLWLSSPKSASFSPSKEQVASIAGLNSVELGDAMEPPIQRKKKPIPLTKTETIVPLEENGVAPYQDYALLGPQGKFAQNVKYRSSQPVRELDKPAKRELAKTYRIPEKQAPPPKVHVDTGAPVHRDPVIPKTSAYEPKRRRDAPKPDDEPRPHRTKKTGDLPPRVVIDTGAPRPALRDKRVGQMNEFAQTDMDKGVADSGQEAPESYALKYRAGVPPPRPSGPKRRSEYQNQFDWKKAPENVPILRAEQAVYKSDTSLPPYKKDIIPKESEYKRQFQDWESAYKPQPAGETTPKKRSKVKRSKSDAAMSPDRRKAAGIPQVTSPEDKRLIKTSVNPVRPFFPHGKQRLHKSEYHSNFKPPWKYKYSKGAWQGASPPHVLPKKESEIEVGPGQPNWFAEVVELRKKADEYRKRAQGTHFSREHLVQLMAKQAELWDQVSESSTLSALSLEPTTKKIKSKSKKKEEEPPKISPVRRKIDWSDKSTSTQSTRGSTASVNSFPSDDDTLVESNEGRVPTPRLRQTQAFQRHHLDRTTPAVGGAILTSPKAQRKSYSSSPSSESSEVPPSRPRPQFREEPANGYKPRDSYSSSSVSSVILNPPPPGGQVDGGIDVNNTALRGVTSDITALCGVTSDPTPDMTSDPRCTSPSYNNRDLPSSPTYGQPSLDTHLLRDDDQPMYNYDRPLETRYVHSPKAKRDRPNSGVLSGRPMSAVPQRRQKINIPSPVNEGYGRTYSKPTQELLAERDGEYKDTLSTSTRSLASSSSLASEVLERARNRRDKFWGDPDNSPSAR